MRRILVVLIVISAVGCTGAAQSGNYAGVSTGFPLTVNLHFGVSDLFAPDTDLRLAGSIYLFLLRGVTVNADVIRHFRADGSSSAPYAGGGAGVGYSTAVIGNMRSGTLVWNVHGLAGYQHQYSDNWGLFGELHLGVGRLTVRTTDVRSDELSSVSSFAPSFAFRLGVNYFF